MIYTLLKKLDVSHERFSGSERQFAMANETRRRWRTREELKEKDVEEESEELVQRKEEQMRE